MTIVKPWLLIKELQALLGSIINYDDFSKRFAVIIDTFVEFESLKDMIDRSGLKQALDECSIDTDTVFDCYHDDLKKWLAANENVTDYVIAAKTEHNDIVLEWRDHHDTDNSGNTEKNTTLEKTKREAN